MVVDQCLVQLAAKRLEVEVSKVSQYLQWVVLPINMLAAALVDRLGRWDLRITFKISPSTLRQGSLEASGN